MSAQNPVHTDIDLRLLENPFTGDISNLFDVECIKRNIKTICTWEKWDYPFSPSIHNYLTDQLFESPSLLAISNIQSRINWLITNFEPRVLIQNIDVRLNNGEDGYSVTVRFLVKNILQTGMVSFALKRVR